MIGEDIIGSEMGEKISKFDYDEQNLFCLNLALDGAPQFISAEFDEGIQQSFEGYFGGESIKQVEAANRDLVNKVIHDIPIANYFIPTWADPTQAPAGCHTAILWLDVPPAPKSWKHGPLNGFDCWDDIKEKLADELVDEFEKYAPGFKNSILERLIYTPLDIYRNNPSAIHGNWMGGSHIPEQFYMNRPLPGVLRPRQIALRSPDSPSARHRAGPNNGRESVRRSKCGGQLHLDHAPRPSLEALATHRGLRAR